MSKQETKRGNDMNNQTITVTKILEVYASIRNDVHQLEKASNNLVRKHYSARCSAKWEVLQVMLGKESQSETRILVESLANRNKEAA